jgi:DNA anti-recombination protein RmuC
MNGQELQEPPVQEHANLGERNGGGIDESAKVDRIRDILFGSQMRDYDVRFQRLDEHLAREAAEARADVQKRIDALEGFFKGEIESVRNRLAAEHAERGQALEKLSRDLADTARALDNKLNSLGEQSGREMQDLRQQLLNQANALSAEIRDKHSQMQAGLNREAEQIRGAMTGREALAEMLSEVSLRLKNEFRVPGA